MSQLFTFLILFVGLSVSSLVGGIPMDRAVMYLGGGAGALLLHWMLEDRP